MTDDTRRHWHGSPGARHEHHNVWTHGGSMGPAGRAPWALTPEMIAAENARRGSDTSTASSTSANINTSPTTTTTTTTNSSSGSGSPPTVSERRRSSNASGERGLFANLHSQKRDSLDPSMAGRRASWNEQREQGGFFAKWWDGYTRGGSK